MSNETTVARTRVVRPLSAMPWLIPLKYKPTTREGMAKIVEALRLIARPPLLPERVEKFVQKFFDEDRISMESICREDPSLLRFMSVRGEDRKNLTDDGLLQIMLGRIGDPKVVLEKIMTKPNRGVL